MMGKLAAVKANTMGAFEFVAESPYQAGVGEIGAELARRGLDPRDRVTVTIQPDELIPARREARLRVIAAGLTDDDIDRLIDEARLRHSRLFDRGCRRYQCFHPRSPEGEIVAKRRGSSYCGDSALRRSSPSAFSCG
jgi:hypothetical protein